MIKSPIQTEEDLLLVKEFIILPLLLDVIQRDITIIKSVKLKFPNLFIECLNRIQDSIIRQLFEVRAELKKRGIKVYSSERTKEYIQTSYRCRGYEHTITLMWELVRVAIEIRYGSLLIPAKEKEPS